MEQKKLKGKIISSLIFIFLLVLAITFLYPIFYMFINSLKSHTEYIKNPFSLPSLDMEWNNYVTMISQFGILNLFKNTLIICVLTTVLILSFGIIASYAFSKMNFKGKNIVYIAIISTMFIPAQVTIIPMYINFSKFHLVNNYWAAVLAYLGMFLPEAILLMASSFRGIPDEMIEAAELDGAGYFSIIRNVVIPMGKPAIMLCIIFYFIITWNDLFTPMILLQDMEVRTVMVALATLMSRYNGDPTFQFAGLTMSAIPAILVYAVFQRNIIKGLSVGAIK